MRGNPGPGYLDTLVEMSPERLGGSGGKHSNGNLRMRARCGPRVRRVVSEVIPGRLRPMVSAWQVAYELGGFLASMSVEGLEVR